MKTVPFFKKTLLACTLLATFTSAAHAITLKVADNHLANDPTVIALKEMGEALKTATNGEVKVRIYANGALGDEAQVLQDVQQGTVDIARVSASNLQAFNDKYSILSMPYLFPGNDKYIAFSTSPLAEKYYDYPLSVGFKGLTFYASAARSFYTGGTPIMTPDDLKGLKIRTMADPTVLDMMKRLGATATPLPYSEVFGALQQKVIDGAENTPAALTEARHGEMMKAYSFDEHTMVPDIVVIGVKTWEKLTPQQQQALKKAAVDSAVQQNKNMLAMQEKAMKDAEKLGVKFYYPEKAAFQQRVMPMYDALPAEKQQQVAEIRQAMGL